MPESKIITIDTDVLIIGGGLSGCMAAINAAAEEGVRVTLVDKSNTKGSGCAALGIDHCWSYIPPVHEQMGFTLDDMWDEMALGPMRKDLFYLSLGTMYERMLDLERWGIKIRYPDSKAPGGFRVVTQTNSVPASFNFDGKPLKRVLTKEAKRRGVNIINRVQMTDLITTNGQLSGAVGVGTRTADIYFFKTKVAVLCTGRLTSRLSRGDAVGNNNTRYGYPFPLSGDGKSMAIRAGLPVANLEFYGMLSSELTPLGLYRADHGFPRNTFQPAARIIDGDGNVIVPRTHFYDWSKLGKEKWSPQWRQKFYEVEWDPVYKGRAILDKGHAEGGGPYYLDFSEATAEEAAYTEWSLSNESLGTQELRYYKGEEGLDLRKNPMELYGFTRRGINIVIPDGLWVDSTDLETGIKNLFTAGDEADGAGFAGSAPQAFTQGWHAGGMAAKRAKTQKTLLPASDELVKARRTMCAEIMNRKIGFHWQEVEWHLQALVDFYCGDVRSEKMLKRALVRLEYVKEAPMKAENAHELARALEVKSLIDNAEVVLVASLERKESRYHFRRADYPKQDDVNWACILLTRKEGKEFKFTKVPFDKLKDWKAVT